MPLPTHPYGTCLYILCKPYITGIYGLFSPRIPREHNQIPRYAVWGTPNCPLKDAIVSGVLPHLPAFNISTSGDGFSRVPCGGNWIDSISANSGWGILYLGGGFKYVCLILTRTRENDPI